MSSASVPTPGQAQHHPNKKVRLRVPTYRISILMSNFRQFENPSHLSYEQIHSLYDEAAKDIVATLEKHLTKLTKTSLEIYALR